jgi:hypothetical protein
VAAGATVEVVMVVGVSWDAGRALVSGVVLLVDIAEGAGTEVVVAPLVTVTLPSMLVKILSPPAVFSNFLPSSQLYTVLPFSHFVIFGFGTVAKAVSTSPNKIVKKSRMLSELERTKLQCLYQL